MDLHAVSFDADTRRWKNDRDDAGSAVHKLCPTIISESIKTHTGLVCFPQKRRKETANKPGLVLLISHPPTVYNALFKGTVCSVS